MIKISLDNAVTPNIKYILTPNKIQPITEIVDFKVDHSALVTTSLQSISELGKQLLKAAADGDIEQIKTLLRKGSPFTSDWLGTSPLHLAAQNNNVEVCELLLRYGIYKDARNKVDRTPLHLAAYEGHYKVVESLVNYGSDIHCRDMLNMTPLHWAVQNGHKMVAELLLKNGAEVKVSNKFSISPQDTARQINKWEILELLQSYENESQTQAAADNLVMQSETEAENLEECSEKNDKDINVQAEPVVINLDNNNQISNIEMLDEGTDFSQSHVIINLENEEVKGDNIQTEKDDDESGDSPINSFKIIDAVLQTNEEDSNFSAVKLLQEHGITMLPNDPDETNILNSVMESGHQVVLTDVGKEVLNSIKHEERAKPVLKNKIITVSPEQFLQMTNGNVVKSGNILDRMKVLPTKPITKRVVMKKNRPTPYGNVIKVQNNVGKTNNKTELKYLMKQLVEAKRTIEEYKVKLRKKELEAERYKNQLKLLME